MKILQQFTVARPASMVWAGLSDVRAVASCLPGAEITEERSDGSVAGRVRAKLGPFSAAFEGEARISRDESAKEGRVEGSGVDRRGGSRSRMLLLYRVTGDDRSATVTLDADLTLQGPISQFGRTGLLNETAAVLVRDFAACLEARLVAGAQPAGGSPAPARPLSLWGLLLRLLRSLFSGDRGEG